MSAALMNEMDRLMDELRAVRRKLEEDNGVGEKMIAENKCPSCGETDYGQHGEFPYNVCGTPYSTDGFKDVLSTDIEARLKVQLSAALEREQALAAHIEVLEAMRVEARDYYIDAHSDGIHDCVTPFDHPGRVATCLARRDLIKQAEALEDIVSAIKSEASDKMHGHAMYLAANIAERKATDLRQQAATL